jgi:hypothetical protein
LPTNPARAPNCWAQSGTDASYIENAMMISPV